MVGGRDPRTLIVPLCVLGFGWSTASMAWAAPPDRPELRCSGDACSFRGRVRIAGERRPLDDASVLLVPAPAGLPEGELSEPPQLGEVAWQRSTRTDADGWFEFQDVPKGRVLLVVLAPGFGRIDRVFDGANAGRNDLDVFVEPSADTPFRQVVRTRRAPTRPAPLTRTLDPEEIRTMPGTQGDALRGLQNLPGLARPPGGFGLLVLRGAPPGQSAVYLGGHRIPRAFHALSVSSVIPAEIIDRVEYAPSNFDATYGNATGGVVVLEPRTPRRDGYHGFGEIDLAGVSAMVEGPVGKGSFAVAAQRAYIDGVLAAADAIAKRVTSTSAISLRPSYYDYQALFDYPTAADASVGFRIFGSGDRTYSDSGNPGFPAGPDLRSMFHRFDFVYRKRLSAWSFSLVPSFRFEQTSYEAAQAEAMRRDFVGALRVEARGALSKRFSLVIGADTEVDAMRASQSAEDILTGTTRTAGEAIISSTGLYLSSTIDLHPVTFSPSVRASAYTLDREAKLSLDPRLTAKVQPHERWTIFAGVGKYSMAQGVDDSAEYDIIGQGGSLGGGYVAFPNAALVLNPSAPIGSSTALRMREALHASGGLGWRFFDGWSAEATGFYRLQDNGTPLQIGEVRVATNTISRAYGLEALLRRDFNEKFYGWLAYTLMWSDVRTVGSETDTTRPSDFDLRHNLVLLGSYSLPRNWRIGGRFRLSTGYPYTPIIGSVSTQDSYLPLLGRNNSARLGLFHQLDLRVDKRWLLRRVLVTAYVDVQNVYNHTNPEAVIYTPDQRDQVSVAGVPIFPTFGVRVDY